MSKAWLSSIWLFFKEIFLDPIIFPFALFIMFAQVWNLVESTPSPFIANFLEKVMNNAEAFPWVYIAFFIIYALWALARGWLSKQERKDRKEMLNIMREINKDLDERSKLQGTREKSQYAKTTKIE
jgi:hypothetical protein